MFLYFQLAVYCLTTSKMDEEERIIGGQKAFQRQFPFQVNFSWNR